MFTGSIKGYCSSNNDDDDLRDEEVFEILVRLPLESVYDSKFVCKRWLFLINDPFFRDYYVQYRSNSDSDPPRRDSFLLFHTFDGVNDTIGRIKGLFLDEVVDDDGGSRKIFSLPLDYIPEFQRSRVDQQKEAMSFEISGACRDLMLLDVGYWYPVPRRCIIICNPITKQWLQLPALNPNPCRNSNNCGAIGFACNPVRGSSRVGFTVVHVGWYCKSDDNPLRRGFVIQVYVSVLEAARHSTDHEHKWSEFRVPFPLDFEWSDCGVKVVCCNGVFYWNGRNCIVAYDPINEPNRCRFINIPAELFDKTYGLAVSGATASQAEHQCLRIYSNALYHGAFMVWELVDCNHKWILKYKEYLPGGCLSAQESFSQTNADKVYFTYCSTIGLLDLSKDSYQVVFELPPAAPGTRRSFRETVSFVVGSWPSSLHG